LSRFALGRLPAKPANPTLHKDYLDRRYFATKEIEFREEVTSKRRLARVRDAFEDRAAAIGALNCGDDLPGVFV